MSGGLLSCRLRCAVSLLNDMTTLFSRIVAGELPAHRLHEDSEYLAFLDIRPIRPGHALVIPKAEIDDVFDLPESLLSGILVFARPVARAIQRITGAERVGLAVVGLEVPHAHIHLVPVNHIDDIDFRHSNPAEDDELREMAQRIREEINAGFAKGQRASSYARPCSTP